MIHQDSSPPTKQIDLQELVLQRAPTGPAQLKVGRKRLVRYALPIVLILAFVGLVGRSLFYQLLPRKQVTVVPVVVTRGTVNHEGDELFRAAGWIEPRPTLVNIAALTEGVVEKLLVVEGQEVHSGEPIAKLIDADAKLSRRQSIIARDLKQAELKSAAAERNAAKQRFENPVHLKAALAEADSLLAKGEAEISKLRYLSQASQAQLKYAEENTAGKLASQDSIAGRLVLQARSERESASAIMEEFRTRSPFLEAEIAALRQRREALSQQTVLLIDESRHVADTQAKYEAAMATLADAELAVEQMELRLSRTTVTAPMAGKILRLLVQPGTRVMGLETAAGQSSSTIASMYNPRQLQVRVDVRLEDISGVQPGQRVVVETASLKQAIQGTVLLPTAAANIQKNTLEVKVAIDDPPSTLSPEMLVTATFLAPPVKTSSADDPTKQLTLMVPRSLVRSGETGDFVWIVDDRVRASRRAVRRGKAATEELVAIQDGLTPTDRLITSDVDNLTNDQPVEIQSEDRVLGIESRIRKAGGEGARN